MFWYRIRQSSQELLLLRCFRLQRIFDDSGVCPVLEKHVRMNVSVRGRIINLLPLVTNPCLLSAIPKRSNSLKRRESLGITSSRNGSSALHCTLQCFLTSCLSRPSFRCSTCHSAQLNFVYRIKSESDMETKFCCISNRYRTCLLHSCFGNATYHQI